jgi:hypothetical protein
VSALLAQWSLQYDRRSFGRRLKLASENVVQDLQKRDTRTLIIASVMGRNDVARYELVACFFGQGVGIIVDKS